MFIAGLSSVLGHSATPGRRAIWRPFTLVGAIVVAIVAGGALPAEAAIVPTVPLGTAAPYAVLGGSTVTNTGNSVLEGSLGLWPGTSITGFPPGLVLAPGVTENSSPAAAQAQADLTAAYVDAANRSIDATTAADLVNLTLVGGVYAGPGRSPLSLSGPLVLDGAGDPTSVFIFQTDSTLVTSSSSTVTLINGAQECNVFWQVGSSATLGTNSLFAGTILALDSITVTSGVTVHGRALARNAAVTLDNDTFTRPTCAVAPPATTTTTVPGATLTSGVPGATPTSGVPGATATTDASGASTSDATGATTTTLPGGATTAPGATSGTVPGDTTSDTATTVSSASTTPPTFPGFTLPRTGPATTTRNIFVLGLLGVAAGALITRVAVRRPTSTR